MFWATGEAISVAWPTGKKHFYRATNPHSGCYFLSKEQGLRVKRFWEKRKWIKDFELSGPLEQAGSGMILPVLKIMKPVIEDYKFLMVLHQDDYGKGMSLRHNDEQ